MVVDDIGTASEAGLAGGAGVTTVRGLDDGPTVVVLGGVHGDEDEGVLAVWRLVHELATIPLAGTVRAVAPAHPQAWAACSRTSPLDDDNLARCFPGDAGGGPTARLASAITAHVIAGSDLVIDLHSAGARYAMPLFCGYARQTNAEKLSEAAAVAFGAPVLWAHPELAPGRSLSAADALGIPAIYAECSGGGQIRAAELDAYVSGVLSVMAMLELVPDSYRREGVGTRWVYGAGDLDEGAQAPVDGLFVTTARAGALLAAGSEIGRLYGYQGQLTETVTAPHDCMVMFLRRQARTSVGDVLYVLAELDDERDRS